MAADFDGELYERYRHGYPTEVLAAIGEALGLTNRDVIVDLECGTGQVTLPIAGLVGAVIGVDPEPSMLITARRAARRAGASNVTWQLGDDRDLQTLGRVPGHQSIDAITIGQALHWMDRRALFDQARGLLRPGAGIAILTNGTPVWLQDSGWSRSVRGFLEQWLEQEISNRCGTDEPAQQCYRDQLLGAILSALGDKLPTGDQRVAFAAGLRQAGFHGGFESRTICPRDRRISADATTEEVSEGADRARGALGDRVWSAGRARRPGHRAAV